MPDSSDAAVHASFRDPGGALLHCNGRVLRVVGGEARRDLETFLKTRVAGQLLESGHLVRTWRIEPQDLGTIPGSAARALAAHQRDDALLFEHGRVPFVNYPYEWPPEMLYSAAELTLDIAREIHKEGFGLKDGTPYNVLFSGPRPVFVDLLSFESRDPRDPTWLPYAQFVRTFLLPLQASRLFGIHPDQTLTLRRDGLEPEEFYRWLSPVRRLMPPNLTGVTLPTWLAGAHRADDTSIYRRKLSTNPEKAAFILDRLFAGLRRSLRHSRPVRRTSEWSRYMDSTNTYSEDSFRMKESFVREAMQEFAPKAVLDVGCNTGHFSLLCARHGARVVGIDYDPVVVGQVWRDARSQGMDVLPLVVNITRPTPALGWRNNEHASFLGRARGSFDLVLMLAVIHHMLVTERIPLPEILSLASEISDRFVLIEYVDQTDAMFRRLLRGRDHLHTDFTREYFEAVCAEKFETVRSRELPTRRLYLLRKK